MSIYGSYGTCDLAGYRIRPTDWWQRHMSSIRGYGECTSSVLMDFGGTEYYFGLPRATFPATLDDWVANVRVYAGHLA